MFLLTLTANRFCTFDTMLRMIVYTLGFILLYRFIVNFLIPVFKVTKMTNDRLRKMQEQMNDMQQQQPGSYSIKNEGTSGSRKGDYIDYEEIK